MTLGDIHEQISASLGRGTAFDTEIPTFVRMAVQWIERNYTFAYMDELREFVVDPTAEEPRVIALPPRKIKEIRFVRIVGSDGLYEYLTRIPATDTAGVEEGTPTAFYLVGASTLMLDNTPTSELLLETGLYVFSAWPTADSATHWLIDNGPDVLIAKALEFIAIRLRDESMLQFYQLQRQEALANLLVADKSLTTRGMTPIKRFV